MLCCRIYDNLLDALIVQNTFVGVKNTEPVVSWLAAGWSFW